jgi:hypothetical protein
MTTAGLPGLWVDYEVSDPTPWTNNQGIVKFLEFPVRLPSMSRRAFHLYWMKHHSPNVMNVTPFAQFMRKYTTTHVYPATVPGIPDHCRQTSHLEGASEVWINSFDEVGDWLGHPSYSELIQPDEPRFIAQDGRVEVIVAKEERLHTPAIELVETGLTKLFLLTRGKPGRDHDERHVGASDHGKRMLEQPTLRRRLKKLVLSHKLCPPYPDGMAFADIDVVLELWFEHPRDIAAFFADPAYEVIRQHETTVFDINSMRALVGKVHVVHDEFSFQPSTTQPLAFSWDD